MCDTMRKSPWATVYGRWIVRFCGAVLSVLLFNGPAWAHKVTIFAWVEGDTVHTQSKFSGGKPAKNSTVVVYDDDGNQLLEGKTDDEGAFSFQVPKRTALTVALKASMGHAAEWRIPAEDITGEPSGSKSNGEAKAVPVNPVREDRQPPLAQTGGDRTVVVASTGMDREEIKALMDQALDTKLAPIVRMLADSVDRGPTIGDIVGGLGYIVGLMGVALYATNRRKHK